MEFNKNQLPVSLPLHTDSKTSTEKAHCQAELFSNRLIKRYKHLKKWAKRTDVSCYRIYDRDIPEIPLAVDLFEKESQSDEQNGIKYLQIALYERPYQKSVQDETEWLSIMSKAASSSLSISETNIFIKTRRKQKGDSQYEKLSNSKIEFTVKEQGERFVVNMSDYLDTGLFFDHRPLRSIVRSQSNNKRVLNLFCYTGAFSVYASTGGASSVDSVDLSSKYLSWAQKNMILNGFTDANRYRFIESDALTFLNNLKDSDYDIIILDPPTFSNSKKTQSTLDINRDWAVFVNLCILKLTRGGVLYFSTNSKRLSFDETLVKNASSVTDISLQTIPEDFRNTHIHRTWRIIR